jgi:hypothetical protein
MPLSNRKQPEVVPAGWAEGRRACLYGDAPHCLDSVARQLLIYVIDVLSELRGNLKGVGLVRNGRQDVQLQGLDVAGLILPAVECCVYLQRAEPSW